MDIITGQPQADLVIGKLAGNNIFGRTIILLGERGCGKFTAALEISRNILGNNPFLSAEFLFYRNDSFSVKTRFFLKNIGFLQIAEKFQFYLFYLRARLSAAISLGEIGNIKLKRMHEKGGSYTAGEFNSDLNNIANNKNYFDLIENNSAFTENLLAISDELSKKTRVPIDFIRSAIEFNSLKSKSGHRVTLIGNYENATFEAQNASLKLFEEPPAGNLVILTADRSAGILPTILSRSLVIHFNPLNPAVLKGIFGRDIKNKYSSTIELMEDDLFMYREKRKEKVIEFFNLIAPRIQQDNSVFSFIDNIIDGGNGKFTVHFFVELCEFIRNAHMLRQEYLRKTDLSFYIDPDYRKLTEPFIKSIYTAELIEISRQIGFLSNKIRYGNLTPAVILPGLLTDLARWFQRAKLKTNKKGE